MITNLKQYLKENTKQEMFHDWDDNAGTDKSTFGINEKPEDYGIEDQYTVDAEGNFLFDTLYFNGMQCKELPKIFQKIKVKRCLEISEADELESLDLESHEVDTFYLMSCPKLKNIKIPQAKIIRITFLQSIERIQLVQKEITGITIKMCLRLQEVSIKADVIQQFDISRCSMWSARIEAPNSNNQNGLIEECSNLRELNIKFKHSLNLTMQECKSLYDITTYPESILSLTIKDLPRFSMIPRCRISKVTMENCPEAITYLVKPYVFPDGRTQKTTFDRK